MISGSNKSHPRSCLNWATWEHERKIPGTVPGNFRTSSWEHCKKFLGTKTDFHGLKLSAPKSRDSLRLRRRFLPLPEKSRDFLRPQDARFPLRRKSLANRDFCLRWKRVKMILVAEFLAIPSSAVKIACERRCAILVHSGLKQLKGTIPRNFSLNPIFLHGIKRRFPQCSQEHSQESKPQVPETYVRPARGGGWKLLGKPLDNQKSSLDDQEYLSAGH